LIISQFRVLLNISINVLEDFSRKQTFWNCTIECPLFITVASLLIGVNMVLFAKFSRIFRVIITIIKINYHTRNYSVPEIYYWDGAAFRKWVLYFNSMALKL
jgi:hypothetical protein